MPPSNNCNVWLDYRLKIEAWCQLLCLWTGARSHIDTLTWPKERFWVQLEWKKLFVSWAISYTVWITFHSFIKRSVNPYKVNQPMGCRTCHNINVSFIHSFIYLFSVDLLQDMEIVIYTMIQKLLYERMWCHTYFKTCYHKHTHTHTPAHWKYSWKY
jgi:hypothetical protein